MFRLDQIAKVVSGRLLLGNPSSRVSEVSIDSRTIKPRQLFIAIKGDNFDGHDFIREVIKKGANAVIFSKRIKNFPRGISTELINEVGFIAVENTRLALSRLASFHRDKFNIPVIAITGSNGKTTTKEMLSWVLSSRAKVLKSPATENNLIGVSLALLKLNNSFDFAVLELGSNHFGEIANLTSIVKPTVGIITNVGSSHLKYLINKKGVFKEKKSLLKGLKGPGIRVLNRDDSYLRRIATSKHSLNITYGINNKSDFMASEIKFTSQRQWEFILNSVKQNRVCLNTIGYANIYNALAVISVARLFARDYALIRKRLSNFVFPKRRLRLVKINGISFIDDTYNANPASLSEAIDVLAKAPIVGRRIFVMGDMLELGKQAPEFHHQAGSNIAGVCDAFICVGGLAGFAARGAIESGLSRDCVFTCQDSRKAGELLFKSLKPNPKDLILVKGSRLMKMEEVLKR